MTSTVRCHQFSPIFENKKLANQPTAGVSDFKALAKGSIKMLTYRRLSFGAYSRMSSIMQIDHCRSWNEKTYVSYKDASALFFLN